VESKISQNRTVMMPIGG